MKPNKKYLWRIVLTPAPATGGVRVKSQAVYCEGDIQGALQAADEAESEVPFEVESFIIVRVSPL